jgi:hypothetical protein
MLFFIYEGKAFDRIREVTDFRRKRLIFLIQNITFDYLIFITQKLY